MAFLFVPSLGTKRLGPMHMQRSDMNERTICLRSGVRPIVRSPGVIRPRYSFNCALVSDEGRRTVPSIATVHRADVVAVNRAATDAPVNPSSAVSVEDFDYDDRFIPVALQIIPEDPRDDGNRETPADT